MGLVRHRLGLGLPLVKNWTRLHEQLGLGVLVPAMDLAWAPPRACVPLYVTLAWVLVAWAMEPVHSQVTMGVMMLGA
jgi:hypothetical protein